MIIELYRTREDEIGDTTGYTNDQIAAFLADIDGRIMNYLHDELPEHTVDLVDGNGLQSYLIIPESDADWQDMQSMADVINYCVERGFTDWVSANN